MWIRNNNGQAITVNDKPIFPPNKLIDWVRRQNIAPVDLYESETQFYQTVLQAIQGVEDKVQYIGAYNSFWNKTYQGSQIIERKPKRETDIHPTIHGYLFDVALAKNLQIIPEYPIAGGNLDFLITGTEKSGKSLVVCAEFKHAHSQDLVHGLTSQLPAYMTSKGTDYGIYCVMYFRGRYFDKPNNYKDQNELLEQLMNVAEENGLDKIKIILLDFSDPAPPSKR